MCAVPEAVNGVLELFMNITGISSAKISNFVELKKYADEKEKEREILDKSWKSVMSQLERRINQLRVYAEYKPLARIYRKSLNLKGFAKLKYDREHKKDLEKFSQVKRCMASLLDNGEKIYPKKWHMEIQSIEKEMDSLRSRQQQKKLGSVQKKRTYDISFRKKGY